MKKVFRGIGVMAAGVSLLAVIAAVPAQAVTTSMSGTQSCSSGAHVGVHGKLTAAGDLLNLYAPTSTRIGTTRLASVYYATSKATSGAWKAVADGKGMVSGSTGSNCVPPV